VAVRLNHLYDWGYPASLIVAVVASAYRCLPAHIRFRYGECAMVFAAWAPAEVVAVVKGLRHVLFQLLVVATTVVLILGFVSVPGVSWWMTAIVLVVAGAVLGLVGSDLVMLYFRRPKHSSRRSEDVR
jgi:lysylphosphatidylglycerol synthetase-like protein (DUF2156 family)